MLVLSRKVGEKIVIPGLDTEIVVTAIKGKAVRLGISAPVDISIRREEAARRDIVDAPVVAAWPFAPGRSDG
jgi:carbon storage regulator CsrA